MSITKLIMGLVSLDNKTMFNTTTNSCIMQVSWFCKITRRLPFPKTYATLSTATRKLCCHNKLNFFLELYIFIFFAAS